MLIYLLSIMSNLQGFFVTVAICAGFFLVTRGIVFVASEGEEPWDTDQARVVNMWTKRALVLLFFSIFFACAIPTRRSLIEAYIITEGSKVATAENAEAVAKELSAKLDKIFDEKKGN